MTIQQRIIEKQKEVAAADQEAGRLWAIHLSSESVYRKNMDLWCTAHKVSEAFEKDLAVLLEVEREIGK